MANPKSDPIEPCEGELYSLWALPPEDVATKIISLMSSLRSEFGGPEFEPHITVVGAIRLTPQDALNKFRSACEGVKAYQATVDQVSIGTTFYQCVFLLIHPTTEVLPSHPSVCISSFGLLLCLIFLLFSLFSSQVVQISSHCCSHFGYNNSTRKLIHIQNHELGLVFPFLGIVMSILKALNDDTNGIIPQMI